MSYVPQPGTIPAKAVDYIRVQAQAGRFWIPMAELEESLDQSGLAPYLERAVRHGLLRKQHMAADRRRCEYAMGDGKALPAPPREQDEPLPPRNRITQRQALWPPVLHPQANQPGEPVKSKVTKKGQPANYVDPDTLSICRDPLPKGRVNFNKYTDVFNKLKPGECIKCAPNEVAQIANSLRKWLATTAKTGQVRTVRYYPDDNRGRVWLLDGKGARS